ncbi:MAG: N-formylglutamate amidohydrolase [Pseudomonadota bacterium]
MVQVLGIRGLVPSFQGDPCPDSQQLGAPDQGCLVQCLSRIRNIAAARLRAAHVDNDSRVWGEMPERERHSIARELDPPFSVFRPETLRAPILFCSPHSGRTYPSILLERSQLQPDALRKSEDCFVDELFACATAFGAPLIAAHFPRAYLDVNREPYELDPDLFDEPLPDYANSRTMRVIGGLGTIARVVSESEPIYGRPLPLAAALERIEKLYRPFHAAIGELLDELVDAFGYAFLVDCHSMPSGAVQKPAAARPDFVIGDRFGSSCDPRLTKIFRHHLNRMGYRVQLNRPYAGGFITEHYGRPFASRHAIQLEINRGLYLHERTFEKSETYPQLAQNLQRFVAELMTAVPAVLTQQIAAE